MKNLLPCCLLVLLSGLLFSGISASSSLEKAYDVIVGFWTDGGKVMDTGEQNYTFEKNLKFRSEFTIGNNNDVEEGKYKITEKDNTLYIEFHITWEASKYGGAQDVDRKTEPIRLIIKDSSHIEMGDTPYKRMD